MPALPLRTARSLSVSAFREYLRARWYAGCRDSVARALLPAAPALMPARCRARVEAERVGKSADAAGGSARATRPDPARETTRRRGRTPCATQSVYEGHHSIADDERRLR